jgi:DNA-binding response OmpR family regulator
MHLLLIEDSGTLANLFRVQLRMIGDHTVTIAATKKEAMAAFEREKFELVFVDMGLEGHQGRGLEIIAEIKAQAPVQRVGVLSSNDIKDMVRLSQKAGAEFYMVKPFTMEGLAVILKGDKEEIQAYQPEMSEGRIIAF